MTSSWPENKQLIIYLFIFHAGHSQRSLVGLRVLRVRGGWVRDLGTTGDKQDRALAGQPSEG